eukprot:m.151661 g.151661  ORF g.151661 m.151661 type:complete len:64 (+) comp13295_c0_seq4:2002-2193(+)
MLYVRCKNINKQQGNAMLQLSLLNFCYQDDSLSYLQAFDCQSLSVRALRGGDVICYVQQRLLV